MQPSPSSRPPEGRVGIYGWGVIAPGARNVPGLEQLLRSGRSALAPSGRAELGPGLFAVGAPDFSFDDYAPWIAERRGEAYVGRLRSKMGENVQFALGATIQAIESQPGLEALEREADEQCTVLIGSGVGDLGATHEAASALDHATRAWNHFWASSTHCSERRRFEAGQTRPVPPPPQDPTLLPIDSPGRCDAVIALETYWVSRSDGLKGFLERFAATERMEASHEDQENAHLSAIRKRLRAQRALIEEVGCPPPPWTAVSSNLIWNVQNAPAAQVTMLLDLHGPAWAPVGACATFGVALKCGRDAIVRGEAKLAIVGTTDPRPDPTLVGAFHDARVMPGNGDINMPFTSLRGTHISGGSCVWILGDPDWCAKRGLRRIGGWLEAVALSSDAEHIITPSKRGPRRAILRAYDEAKITARDVAVIDLHATGTPGDLNELALVEDFVNAQTRITARKGQLGHGMANSGGWELTALALGLARGAALPTGIRADALHERVPHPERIVGGSATIDGPVGVKLMLGIGGITACVVLRGSEGPSDE